MIKKILSASIVLVLALSLFSISSKSALATNNPSWHWSSYEISPNVYIDVAVDDRCDSANPAFKMTIFEGPNQTGARARLCGYWDDLSQLPQYRGANAPSFNNSISSIWVKDLPGVTYFVELHTLKDQGGDNFLSYEAKVDFTGEYSEYNNKFSSLKRVQISD